MNDINEMPPVCAYCPYWEACKPPYICPDIGDNKPETHDKRTETHACDLISRQAAIDAVTPFDDEYRIRDAIEDLPSAQPETAERTAETAQNVSDEDLISRKAAIDALVKDCKASDEGMLNMYDIVCDLKDVPSAQPEQDIEHCATCIHAADSEDICILRKCKYAIAELKDCYEPKRRWTPCDKGEPNEDMECWVTVKTTDALYRGNFTKRYGERRDKGFITSGGFMWWNPALAWMPIYEPEPYKGEKHE